MDFNLNFAKKENGEKITVKVNPKDQIKKTIAGVISYWDMPEDVILTQKGKKINLNLKWSETDLDDGGLILIRPNHEIKNLPENLWLKRIDNEIESLKKCEIIIIKKELHKEGTSTVCLRLEDLPGPVKFNSSLGLTFNHEFKIKIPRSYPYLQPYVNWLTPIFHPNIKPVKDGGDVNIDYLNEWVFGNNFKGLISKIKSILLEPEIKNTWNNRVCKEATEFYISNGFPKPYS